MSDLEQRKAEELKQWEREKDFEAASTHARGGIEQRKTRMAAACAARLKDADFEGSAMLWGRRLAEVYYGAPYLWVPIPVGMSPLLVERDGLFELTKAGVSWVEEAERRFVARDLVEDASCAMAAENALWSVASEKCEVRSEKDSALPGWAERAVSRPDRRQNEGRAIARELEKVRRLAAGYGRKWEAKVAERAARWIAAQVTSGKCDVRSDEGGGVVSGQSKELRACVCGEVPESQVLGIGVDEYDEIECPACNRMVRQRRGDAFKAVDIWNEMLSAVDIKERGAL